MTCGHDTDINHNFNFFQKSKCGTEAAFNKMEFLVNHTKIKLKFGYYLNNLIRKIYYTDVTFFYTG